MRRFSSLLSRLIEAHLSSMNYDAHKLPLGMIRFESFFYSDYSHER